MNGTIVTPEPHIERDRWGRPLVVPPTGGKKVAYQRCTSYIDVLDDKWNLQQWEKRMVALGLADRPDLMLAVAAHRDDKKALNRICDDAKEAAKGSAAATTGTALHALTELVDRGQDLPVLPESAKADLEAYRLATEDLKSVYIEQFLVQDALKVGGTPDRIVELDGKRFIADLKTGSIEWGMLKIACQLAMYARSHTYDIATGERGSHGADLKRGLVIHLPAGTATCSLFWVDLETGWSAVNIAKEVRARRALKFNDLTEPYRGAPSEVGIRTGPEAAASAEADKRRAHERLEQMIRGCPTADDVRALWADHEASWDDALTEVARKHIASLPEAS